MAASKSFIINKKIMVLHGKNNDFRSACRDYFYLINRKYPERGSLKIVGDHYRLTRDDRTVLYRGISPAQKCEMRRSKLVSNISGKAVFIDGYNVLFTLLNYRLGRITFVSNDSILRDAGSLHGKLRDQKTFTSCVDLMIAYLSASGAILVQIYLDSPVSHSEQHALAIQEKLHEAGLGGQCYVVRSADWALKQAVNGIIATSDTVIIDHSSLPVADLPREILEKNYQAKFLDISGLLYTD